MGVPEAIPVTEPVDPTTVAWAVLLLVHVPPLTELVNVVERPTHTAVAPPIAAGEGLMVTGVETKQPVGNV